MTSSNGNIFRVNGHLCGKFTGHRSHYDVIVMVPVHRSNEEWPMTWSSFYQYKKTTTENKLTKLTVRIILVMCVVRSHDVSVEAALMGGVFKLSYRSEMCHEIRQQYIIIIFWLSPSLNVRNKTSNEYILEHATLRYPHSVRGNQLLTRKGQFNLKLRKLPNRDSMQNSWILMVFSSNVYILNWTIGGVQLSK